jgi:histidine triad (HIT) family protein
MEPEPCLFCKIIAGQIPAEVVGQTADSLAFRDIAPVAPTHVLVVPKGHVPNVGDLANDPVALADLFTLADDVAEELGLGGGYRLVTNTGEDGGQDVFHAHLHVIGGRPLLWPPG